MYYRETMNTKVKNINFFIEDLNVSPLQQVLNVGLHAHVKTSQIYNPSIHRSLTCFV